MAGGRFQSIEDEVDASAAVVVVLVTTPAEMNAEAFASQLVSEHLVACVNLTAPIRSLYRWEGAVCVDTETLCILKTTADRLETLHARLLELHPADVPEFLVVEATGGHTPYLEWVTQSTRTEEER